MAHLQKHPLRTLSEQEERELHRMTKATSERLDVIHRATALLAVASGESFTETAHQVGLKSGDGVGKLVKPAASGPRWTPAPLGCRRG